MNVGLESYLMVSAMLFCLGLYTVCTRKNAVAILMGIELVLNSAGLNFVAFSHFGKGGAGLLDGQIFTIFIIALAAAEATVALAIVVSIYMNFHSIRADQADLLKD